MSLPRYLRNLVPVIAELCEKTEGEFPISADNLDCVFWVGWYCSAYAHRQWRWKKHQSQWQYALVQGIRHSFNHSARQRPAWWWRTLGEEPVSGVYFLIKNGQIVYVGTAKDIERRVAEHRADKDFDHYRIHRHPYPCKSSIFSLETKYVQQFRPRYNKQIRQAG